MTAHSDLAAHRAAVVGVTLTQAPADRVLAGLIQQGHGRAACAAYLGQSEDANMARVVHLDLPSPRDVPIRESRGARAWNVDTIRRLIDLWCRNLTAARIGEDVGRSASAIINKARWLGLYQRDRKSLLHALPLFPLLDLPRPKRRELVWTEAREDWLAERWFSMQHHAAIARDATAEWGVTVSATTVASKAHSLQLPRRDRYFLIDTYAPGNRERHAHLFPRLVRRMCPFRHRWFWAPPAGDRTSAKAKAQSAYRAIASTVH